MVSYLCNVGGVIAVNGPVVPGVPGQPTDTGAQPNEGVIRGGLFTPTPVPIPVDPPSGTLPMERPAGRFDQVRPEGGDLDDIKSIPARVTRKMKEVDARRERGEADAAGTTRAGFDRVAPTDKPEKRSTADAGDAPARAQPPSREPTKAKASEPRRETPRSRNGNFGSTGRTSEPRSSTGRDMGGTRSAKPASAPASNPGSGSVQGTSTTDKKKPPQD
jgi:hypothetical protein